MDKVCLRLHIQSQIPPFVEVLVTSNAEGFLFSLEDYTWRMGPTLPADIRELDYVQLDNGFMVVSGKEDEELGLAVDVAHVIDDEYNWTTYSKAFDTSKYQTMGINVPYDFLNC